MRRFLVVNESTAVAEGEAWNCAWALNWWLRWQVSDAWPEARAAEVTYWPHDKPLPPGVEVIHLLDTSDQPGALGYHTEDGQETPVSRVFVKTAQQDGVKWTAVAAHELAEGLVNPHVYRTSLAPSNKLYPEEVGDPAQGNDYQLGQTGIWVCDIATPPWFDPNTPPTAPSSLRGNLQGPFAVGPGGYVSYLDLNNLTAGWQQDFGHNYKGPIDHDRQDRKVGR